MREGVAGACAAPGLSMGRRGGTVEDAGVCIDLVRSGHVEGEGG